MCLAHAALDVLRVPRFSKLNNGHRSCWRQHQAQNRATAAEQVAQVLHLGCEWQILHHEDSLAALHFVAADGAFQCIQADTLLLTSEHQKMAASTSRSEQSSKQVSRRFCHRPARETYRFQEVLGFLDHVCLRQRSTDSHVARGLVQDLALLQPKLLGQRLYRSVGSDEE